MDLREVQSNWEAFGDTDPLWAILSAPGKRGGGWDPEEFFDSGRTEILTALTWVEELGLQLGRHRALDFGCGVGRLSQGLAEHFEYVDGVDIAGSMIDQARSINRFGERCAYHVNDRPDLSLFEDCRFDFVYSVLVLQHIEPRYTLSYLDEFARVLAPGGVAVLQIPSGQLVHPAMPADACVAEIGFRRRLPWVLHAGDQLDVPLRVRNASSQRWPCEDFNVGNHWRTLRGRIHTLDDGRQPLAVELSPGDEVDVVLSVRVPTERGLYWLEVDLVQEGIRWFSAGRHVTKRSARPVLVRTLSRGDDAETPTAEPVMEMHAVPREEVEERLRRCGLAVVTAREDDRAGRSLVSHTYVAVKPRS